MINQPGNGERHVATDSHKLAIETAMREAVSDAVLAHQRLGLPMVEWHDGKIVLVPADQLSAGNPRSAR